MTDKTSFEIALDGVLESASRARDASIITKFLEDRRAFLNYVRH